MCMIDDAEISTLWNEHPTKARVQHRCTECTDTIQPGTRYLKIDSLYDGHWTTYKLCGRCWAAAEWLMRECSGYLVGAIWDDVYEHHWAGHRKYGMPFLRAIVDHRRRPPDKQASAEQYRQWFTAASDRAMAVYDLSVTEMLATS